MRSEAGRVAVVGCGLWGRNLVRNFHQLGALKLVCEPSPAGQATSASISPDVPIFSDFESALRADVEGVVIATPAETHHRLARAALMADKDVLVEKPLALSRRSGSELVELARQRQRILMVGHVLEYHPAVARLRELVGSGVLGRLHYLYSNRLSLGKVRREENILWSFAPHDVAVILRLAQGMPTRVTAAGANYLQPRVADVTVTNLFFPNRVQAHIFVSWLHPFKEQRLVVIGSEKMASFDDVSKRLVLYDRRIEWMRGRPRPVRGEGEEVEFSTKEPLRAECEAFLEAIRTRRPPLTDGLSGLRVLEVLDAAQESLGSGAESHPIAPNPPQELALNEIC